MAGNTSSEAGLQAFMPSVGELNAGIVADRGLTTGSAGDETMSVFPDRMPADPDVAPGRRGSEIDALNQRYWPKVTKRMNKYSYVIK